MCATIRIRSYPLDEPWSIKLFSKTLPTADKELHPFVLFGTFGQKWLGYVDKYIIFGFYLILLRIFWLVCGNKPTIHMVDQSGGIYVPLFWGLRTVVTCHDILATRGAMGDTTVGCTPSYAGKLLQHLIAAGLKQATVLIAASQSTAADIQNVFCRTSTIIPLGIPANLSPSNTRNERLMKYSSIPVITEKYLLMVGGNMERKNRPFALEILARLPKHYFLVFAGEGQPVEDLPSNVKERVVSLPSPSVEVLTTLYEQAHVLLFPSISEGFGIPIIEAQQCLCPVIGSNKTSVPEVIGFGGYVLPIFDVEPWVRKILELENPDTRKVIQAQGVQNLTRFTVKEMQDKYFHILGQ